jgi:hypothetical protein
MVIHPGVKIKPVERDSCCAHWNLNEIWPYIAFEDRRPYSEIGRCLGRAKQPWEKNRQHLAMPKKS